MDMRKNPDGRDLCAHTGEGDFIDPRDDYRERRREERSSACGKDLALCKQARRALELSLASWPWAIEIGLRVVGVEPAPDARRLRVIVEWADTAAGASAVLAELGRARGRLRADVAAAITRKRAPQLTFAPAPREEARHD